MQQSGCEALCTCMQQLPLKCQKPPPSLHCFTQDHNLYSEKVYVMPRILKCNHQLCSGSISTFCQTPLSSFGMNSLHISVISWTMFMQVLWVCVSCFHMCLHVGSHLCNNVLKLQKSLQICVTSFHFSLIFYVQPQPTTQQHSLLKLHSLCLPCVAKKIFCIYIHIYHSFWTNLRAKGASSSKTSIPAHQSLVTVSFSYQLPKKIPYYGNTHISHYLSLVIKCSISDNLHKPTG